MSTLKTIQTFKWRKHPLEEKDFLLFLKRYNKEDALVSLGLASSYVFDIAKEKNNGFLMLKDPVTGRALCQSCLAYIANLLLISKSNDYKRELLSSSPEQLFDLQDIYTNKTIDPSFECSNGQAKHQVATSIFMWMEYEQFRYQFNFVNTVSRSYIIYQNLFSRYNSEKLGNLSNIFEKVTGLSIKNYFLLGLITWQIARQTAIINAKNLLTLTSSSTKEILTPVNINNLLKILSINYKEFRENDKLHNKGMPNQYTKNRFNLLFKYPIIKTSKGTYVIPNFVAYLSSIFEGIYWWFNCHFQDQGKDTKESKEFRDYFGIIHEYYTGLLLKSIFKDVRSDSDVALKKGNKFVDWTVMHGNKVYLFEVKALQVPLDTLTKGDMNKLKKLIRRESGIADSVIQLYRRIQDINKYEELSLFRNKEIIPIIVLLNTPFTDFFRQDILDELRERKKFDSTLESIEKFNVSFMNIKELENMAAPEDIESHLKIYSGQANPRPNKLNPLLKATYSELCTMLGIQK